MGGSLPYEEVARVRRDVYGDEIPLEEQIRHIAGLIADVVNAETGLFLGEDHVLAVFKKRWDRINLLSHQLHRALERQEPMTAVRRADMKAERQRAWPTRGA